MDLFTKESFLRSFDLVFESKIPSSVPLPVQTLVQTVWIPHTFSLMAETQNCACNYILFHIRKPLYSLFKQPMC